MRSVVAAMISLPILAMAAIAAPPPRRGSVLQAQPFTSLPAPPAPPRRAPVQQFKDFEPAPIPNRDLGAPLGPPASATPQVSPGLFTRSDQYRGDGFSQGSTAQTEQDRRVLPGAGFKLRLPLQRN